MAEKFKVSIASDHAGFEMKKKIMEHLKNNDFSLIEPENTHEDEPISDNVINSLNQDIVIEDGYFGTMCYTIYDRIADENIAQGTAPLEDLSLGDLIETLETGLYWLVLEECVDDCSSRDRSNLPIPFDFIFDIA